MICSIIDIGSNTIRLSVYQLQEGTIIPLLHKKTMAGLASYIQDGCMSEEGIHTAIRVLNQYRSLLEHLSIQQVSVFATASLREISNTIQAVKMIQKETGFLIDVISGKREAILDFLGATHILDMKEGILVDIEVAAQNWFLTKMHLSCKPPVWRWVPWDYLLNLSVNFFSHQKGTEKKSGIMSKTTR